MLGAAANTGKQVVLLRAAASALFTRNSVSGGPQPPTFSLFGCVQQRIFFDLFWFFESVSLCCSDLPGTHKDSPASASPVLDSRDYYVAARNLTQCFEHVG